MWAETESLNLVNKSIFLEERRLFFREFNQVANYLLHRMVGQYNIRNLWQLEIVWIAFNTVLSEMEFLFEIIWEIPKIRKGRLCFSECDLEVAMSESKCSDWNAKGDVLQCPAEPGERLWHHAITQKVASIIYSVRRKPVILFIIIHLHIIFGVMVACFLNTVGSWVYTLQLFSGF